MRSTVRIVRSELQGTVTAPPSKSYAQRAVALSLLCDGCTEILNYPACDDALAALGIAEALGAAVDQKGSSVEIQPRVGKAASSVKCSESGLSMRMFAPIAALGGDPVTLLAEGSLRSREMIHLENPLRQLGAVCRTSAGRAPVTVMGPLTGGEVCVDSSVTSQFLTGLLIALPMAKGDSVVHVRKLSSVPYVRMTLEAIRTFGGVVDWNGGDQFHVPGGQRYNPNRFTVEGDWSGASFMLVAGAIAGEVEVRGLNPSSLQGDSCILSAIEMAGGRVSVNRESVQVQSGVLKPFEFCVSQCPDLAPPLAALAACCPGTSIITGTSRLSYKESDRNSALAEELCRLGISTSAGSDCLRINGGGAIGGTGYARGDHRIAMTLAVAGLTSYQGIVVRQADSVTKSYPDFFVHLSSMGVCVDE